MSSSSSINNPSVATAGLGVFEPTNLVGDLQDAKSAALRTLQQSFHVLGNFTSDGTQSAAEGTGLPDLEKPNLSKQVNDLTLRIGLLQDALNQLMSQVSKMEIQQRLGEMQKENQKELERFQEQMEKAREAAEKNKEAAKKGNIFEAVSNWIQAVVSVVSAIVTIASALGQVLTNPVGAAALIVAGVALIGAAAVQITLAIDATMRAAGQEGFLSEADKQKMQKAAEILGYIALAASMIGLIGGAIMAFGQAGKAAASVAGKEIGKAGTAKLLASGTKDAVVNGMKNNINKPLQLIGQRGLSVNSNMTLGRLTKAAFDQALEPLMKFATRLATVYIVGTGMNQAAVGVGNHQIADIKKQASDLQAESDEAAAAAKAISAQIAKLKALIEQLQQELENMVEQLQATLEIIFGAIDDTAKTTATINHSTPA